jgi:nucleoside-diphosphate-sugar epimerase
MTSPSTKKISGLRVLVTGASGFVGSALCQYLLAQGAMLSVLTRSLLEFDSSVKQHLFTDLETVDPIADWFEGVDIVIHLAARVHQMNPDPKHELARQMSANRDATVKLAAVSGLYGVKQFIYLSTVKVNGEHTDGRAPFSELDTPAPVDAYGLSKWEAEKGLSELAATSDLAITVIRPPLIYGENVKANFAALLNLSVKGIPLPFACIKNARSIISVDNLVSFVSCCCANNLAMNQIFLVADDKAISTPSLVGLMARSQGSSTTLIPIPIVALKLLGLLVNKTSVIERLTQSLELNCSKAEKLIGWRPPATTEDEFERYANKWMA